eukprot:TRINITY_DN257_c0_g1_i1.p1 TRINITY_DN257_c0_g1~~TRINITY_DN257_c0_g1_i1.p1  ORF type:complete len:178 (-),score=59.31 TRINITY_DN257_c0_g1_i1:416-949(-)
MVYHSEQSVEGCQVLCGCAVTPLRTKVKGPAPRLEDPEARDILDEVLHYFKANMLYRTFDVRGPADRTLIYMTLYVHHCLKKVVKQDKDKAAKTLYSLAQEHTLAPGDGGFILPGFIPSAADAKEAEAWRQFIKQLKEEVGQRLVEKLYEFPEEDKTANKFWIAYTKKKFLGKSFEN